MKTATYKTMDDNVVSAYLIITWSSVAVRHKSNAVPSIFLSPPPLLWDHHEIAQTWFIHCLDSQCMNLQFTYFFYRLHGQGSMRSEGKGRRWQTAGARNMTCFEPSVWFFLGPLSMLYLPMLYEISWPGCSSPSFLFPPKTLYPLCYYHTPSTFGEIFPC